MQNTIEKIILSCLLCAVFFAAGFFLSCSLPPKRDNFESRECYKFIYCLHENKKNPDKSICSRLDDSCTAAMVEERRYDRLKFCEEKKLTGMTASECRMYLNQK